MHYFLFNVGIFRTAQKDFIFLKECHVAILTYTVTASKRMRLWNFNFPKLFKAMHFFFHSNVQIWVQDTLSGNKLLFPTRALQNC